LQRALATEGTKFTTERREVQLEEALKRLMLGRAVSKTASAVGVSPDYLRVIFLAKIGGRGLGLFKGMKDPVHGTAEVLSGDSGVSISNAPHTSGRDADRDRRPVPATEVEVKGLMPTKHPIERGDAIRVVVDRTNRQRVKIEWSKLPTARDKAESHAQLLDELERLDQENRRSLEEASFDAPVSSDQPDPIEWLTNLNAPRESGALFCSCPRRSGGKPSGLGSVSRAAGVFAALVSAAILAAGCGGGSSTSRSTSTPAATLKAFFTALFANDGARACRLLGPVATQQLARAGQGTRR
jgi:hypothetical protein